MDGEREYRALILSPRLDIEVYSDVSLSRVSICLVEKLKFQWLHHVSFRCFIEIRQHIKAMDEIHYMTWNIWSSNISDEYIQIVKEFSY